MCCYPSPPSLLPSSFPPAAPTAWPSSEPSQAAAVATCASRYTPTQLRQGGRQGKKPGHRDGESASKMHLLHGQRDPIPRGKPHRKNTGETPVTGTLTRREYIWLQKLSSLNPGLAPSTLGLTTEGWPWGCPNPDVLCPSTNFAPRHPLTKHHFHVLFDCQQTAPGCLSKEAEQKRTRWSVWRRTEARPSNCGPGASLKRQSQLKAPGVLPECHGWPLQSTPAPAPHG